MIEIRLVGTTVNMNDGSGNLLQGQIVAAWLSPDNDEPSMRVAVQCSDNLYREAWLVNVRYGAIPRPKEDR